MTQPSESAGMRHVRETLEKVQKDAAGFAHLTPGERAYLEHVPYLLERLEAQAGEPVAWMAQGKYGKAWATHGYASTQPEARNLFRVGDPKPSETRLVPLYRHPHQDRGEVVAWAPVIEDESFDKLPDGLLLRPGMKELVVYADREDAEKDWPKTRILPLRTTLSSEEEE